MANMREDEQAKQLTKFLEGDHSLVEKIEEDVLLSVFLLRPDWMHTQHPTLLRPSISIEQVFERLQSGVFVEQVHSNLVDDSIGQDIIENIEEHAENVSLAEDLAEDIEWMENVLGTHNRRPSLTIDGILATVQSGPFSTGTTGRDAETKKISYETLPTKHEYPNIPRSANNQRWYTDFRIMGLVVAAMVLFVIVPMEKPSEPMSSAPKKADILEEMEQENIHMTETKHKKESVSKEMPPSSATIASAKDVMSTLEKQQQSVEQSAKKEPAQRISIETETTETITTKQPINEINKGGLAQEILPSTQKPTRAMEPSTQQRFSTTPTADMTAIEEEEIYVTDNDAPAPLENQEYKEEDGENIENVDKYLDLPEEETVQQSAVEDIVVQVNAPKAKSVVVESTSKSAKNTETRSKADSRSVEKKSADRKNTENAGASPSASEDAYSRAIYPGSTSNVSSVLSTEQKRQAQQITTVEQAQGFCAQTNATVCVDMLYIASKPLMPSTAISLLLLTNNYPSAQPEYLRRNFATLSQLYRQIGNIEQAEVYSTKAQ